MKHYTVEPKVAGGWGDGTQVERISGQGTVVHRLHYEFQGWLGDDLLESSPCFIVSSALGQAIRQAELSSVTFDRVQISKAPEFEERQPECRLPSFEWLKVAGRAGLDDCGMSPGGKLVISERSVHVMSKYRLANAVIARVGK